MKDLKSFNGLSVRGFIDVDLVNKKKHIKQHFHNTVTNAGKSWIFNKSIGPLFNSSGSIFGRMIGISYFDKIIFPSSYSSCRYANQKSILTNFLLSNDSSAYTAETSCIPVQDENGQSTIIGYANNNIEPVKNGLEGSVDTQKAEYVTGLRTLAGRWKYPEGIATGKIKTIAMMPGLVRDTPTNMPDGWAVYKCIDKVSLQASTYVNMSTGFCPPGVPPFTDDHTILLNYNQDGITKHKYDISTGEITDITDDSTPFWCLPSSEITNATDYIVVDGYLYLAEFYRYSSYYYTWKIYVVNLSNTSETHTISPVSADWESSYAIDSIPFFYYDGTDLYLTTVANKFTDINSNNYKNSNFVFKLSKGSSSYFGSVDTQYKDYSFISGLKYPAGLVPGLVGIKGINTSDKTCLMFVYVQSIADKSSSDTITCAAEFTSLTSPLSSITNFYYKQTTYALIFTGTYKGVIMLGAGYKSSYDNNDFDCPEKKLKIFNTTESGGKEYDLEYAGAWISLVGQMGSLLSFVNLTTPIDKTDTDILYVSYGYEMVSST